MKKYFVGLIWNDIVDFTVLRLEKMPHLRNIQVM